MNTIKYLLYFTIALFVLNACEKEKDNETNKSASKLIGTWVEGKDSPWYSDGERIIITFKENGECIEYTIEHKGNILEHKCFYTFNPQNGVLTLSSGDDSREPYFYHVIKFIDDDKIIFYDSDFLKENGFDKDNLPVDDKHYKEELNNYHINFILHRGEFPVN